MFKTSCMAAFSVGYSPSHTFATPVYYTESFQHLSQLATPIISELTSQTLFAFNSKLYPISHAIFSTCSQTTIYPSKWRPPPIASCHSSSSWTAPNVSHTLYQSPGSTYALYSFHICLYKSRISGANCSGDEKEYSEIPERK